MKSGSDGEVESERDHSKSTANATDLSPAVLRQLLDRTGDFLFTTDGTGCVESVSADVESVLGYEPAEITGEPLSAILAVDVKDNGSRLFDAESTEVAVPFETAHSGTVHTMVSTAVADGGNTVCLARDVTEQVARDHELDRYVQLVENVDDPMYVLDAGGTVELVNDAMVEYTGYPKAELLGQSVDGLGSIVDEDDPSNVAPDCGFEGSRTIETTLVGKDGDPIPTEANITPIHDEDGSRAGTVGVLRDIRDRTRREQDLELLKQVLTRVFRHNIRNELMVVRGFTDLIEAAVENDIDEYLDEIEGAIDALLEYGDKARKIEDVMESPGYTETTLAREIDLALGQIQDTYPDARIDITDLPEVGIEAHPKITTAIEELLDNAIRHTPEGRDPHVEIWGDAQDDAVTLFIEDNAGGLEDNEISVLQQGTESDLEHSSGVGLWLVQWIVDYSDAELIVHRTETGTLMGIRFS